MSGKKRKSKTFHLKSIPRSRHLNIFQTPFSDDSFLVAITYAIFKDELENDLLMLSEEEKTKAILQCAHEYLEFPSEKEVLEEKLLGHGESNPKVLESKKQKIEKVMKKFRIWEKQDDFKHDRMQDIGCIHEAIEDEKNEVSSREVEELLFSGITSYQVEFILLNAMTFEFCVNIFGYFSGSIYPIHIGIGARRCSSKAKELTVINLFKIGLHRGDVSDPTKIKESLESWTAQGMDVINRVECEQVIQEALVNSETAEEQLLRKKCKEVFNWDVPYKEEKKTAHKKWAKDLKVSEGFEIETFFFRISDLNLFLVQYYVSEETGNNNSARNANFCPRCITPFYSKHSFKLHKDLCVGKKDYFKEILPCDTHRYNPARKFDKHYAKERNAINIFADFEAILQPGEDNCKECHKNGVGRCRCMCVANADMPVSIHKPACFVIIAVNAKGQLITEEIIEMKDDNDANLVQNGSEMFIKTLLKHEDKYKAELKVDKSPPPSREDVLRFLKSTHCCICDEQLDWEKDFFSDKWDNDLIMEGLKSSRKIESETVGDEEKGERIVFHHNHATEQWRSGAHSYCNFTKDNMRHAKVNVYLHNLGRYDISFILPGLAQPGVRQETIHGLSKNKEQIRTISFNSFRLIDSMGHLSASIRQLTQNLKDSAHSFPIMRQSKWMKTKNKLDEEKLEIAQQKGYMCYSFCTSLYKIKEQKTLPKIEQWTEKLGGTVGIKPEELEFAQKSWDVYGCKNLFDYMKIYCLIDTLCLAEIFTEYNTKMHEVFGLYPDGFLTLPSYAFESNLFVGKAELPYMEERSLYRTYEESIRGGFAFVNHKVGTSTKPEFPGDTSRKLFYTDATSLYSVAMLQKLPVSDFTYLSEDEIEKFDVTGDEWDVNGEFGYFLLCDIDYPEELHKTHSEMPFFPERKKIDFDQLSPYSQSLLKKLGNDKTSLNTPKLVGDLNPKLNYGVHWKYLQIGLRAGLKISKIHQIIKFKQDAICEKYIRLCVKSRSNAKNPFEKELYKLAQNAIFGKFLENIRKRTKVNFITSKKLLKKHSTKATYTDIKYVTNKLVISYHRQETVVLDRFPYIGSAILDLGKCHIMKTLYFDLMPHLGEDFRIIFGDTDSLFIMYKSTSKDNNDLMKKIIKIMDTSNYEPDHELYSKERKAVPNYFKDESGGSKIYQSIVAASVKMYHVLAVKKEDFGKEDAKLEPTVKAKGVPTKTAAQLTHAEYLECVLEAKKFYRDYQSICIKDYILTTNKVTKLALSAGDTKRYWLCPQHSLPYGHYEIKYLVHGVCKYCEQDKLEKRTRVFKKRKIESQQVGIAPKRLNIKNQVFFPRNSAGYIIPWEKKKKFN